MEVVLSADSRGSTISSNCYCPNLPTKAGVAESKYGLYCSLTLLVSTLLLHCYFTVYLNTCFTLLRGQRGQTRVDNNFCWDIFLMEIFFQEIFFREVFGPAPLASSPRVEATLASSPRVEAIVSLQS